MGYRFPGAWASYRAVLSHDWLTGMRGGERCLELLCEGLPDAPVFTLVHEPECISETINRHPVHTSCLQRLPVVRGRFRHLLPFFPRAVERFRPPPADLVISTSHCVAKGIRPPAGGQTPLLLLHPDAVRDLLRGVLRPPPPAAGGGATGAGPAAGMGPARLGPGGPLRGHQRTRPGAHPTVLRPRGRRGLSAGRYGPLHAGTARATTGFDLVVSALVPYKRIDLAVRAYTRLGYPLTVVGTGTEDEGPAGDSRPERSASWAGKSDEEIADLYRGCRCLVFPGEEDFGIVPLEAQACGKPVVAFGKGGALETVQAEVSGVFFKKQDENSLLEAVETCAAAAWNPAEIRGNALNFSIQTYIDGLDRSLRAALEP